MPRLRWAMWPCRNRLQEQGYNPLVPLESPTRSGGRPGEGAALGAGMNLARAWS